MDRLTFFSNFFSSAAWPIAAVVIALLLRKPISSLLAELRTLKWKGLEAEFEKDLGRARDLIDQESKIDTPPLTSQHFPERNRDMLLRLAELSPRSVVLEAWREIETAAGKTLLQGDTGPGQRNLSTVGAGKALLERGLVNEAEFQVLSILRNLRNRAAHEKEFELTKEDALEYAIIAQRLAASLETLGDAPKVNSK